MIKIQFRHLHYFIAVAEELSFRQAAERLHVSQPTLSLQIAQLEELVGGKLLDRDKRHVSLTDVGELMYRESVEIVEKMELSINKVKNCVGQAPLVLGVPNYHTYSVVSEILQRFTSEHPDSPIVISELPVTQMVDALNSGKLDASFLTYHYPPEGERVLEKKLVSSEPYLICFSDDYVKPKSDKLVNSDLAAKQLYLLPRETDPAYHDMIVNHMKKAGFDLTISNEATSIQAQYGLVSAGLGVCLTLASSPLPVGVAALPLDPPFVNNELSLVWHKDNLNSALADLLAIAHRVSNISLKSGD